MTKYSAQLPQIGPLLDPTTLTQARGRLLVGKELLKPESFFIPVCSFIKMNVVREQLTDIESEEESGFSQIPRAQPIISLQFPLLFEARSVLLFSLNSAFATQIPAF